MKYFIISNICLVLCLSSLSQRPKDTLRKKNDTDTLFVTIENNKFSKKYKNDVYVRFLDAKNPMHITVKNINPFLYNITMKEFQNDYLNEMRNENIQVLNYSMGNLAINFPEPNRKNLLFLIPNEQTKRQFENIEDSINSLQKKINQIYSETIYPNEDSIRINPDDRLKFQGKIDTADYDVAKLIKKIEAWRTTVSGVTQIQDKEQVFIGLQKNFIDLLNEYNNNVVELQKMFNFYQALKILVYTPGISIDSLKSLKPILMRRYLNNMLKDSSGFKNFEAFNLTYKYHGTLNKIAEVINRMNETYSSFMFKKGKSSEEVELAMNMKSMIEWLNEEQKKLSTNAMDNIISTTTLLYESINDEMFTQNYVIENIKDKTDFVQFVFDAVPKMQTQSIILPKPISYKVVMPIKQGVQMNVSSGVFFNLGLNSEEWYYKPTDKLDTFQLTRSKYKLGDLFRPSIGVLLHIYKRSPYADRLAGSFGFSTNATDINYYAGGSWIIGKSQRFVFTTGFVGGQKDVIKSTFGEGDMNMLVSKDFKEKNPLIETNKKFKVGVFFSFTFNLWGKATKDFNFESNGVKDPGK